MADHDFDNFTLIFNESISKNDDQSTVFTSSNIMVDGAFEQLTSINEERNSFRPIVIQSAETEDEIFIDNELVLLSERNQEENDEVNDTNGDEKLSETKLPPESLVFTAVQKLLKSWKLDCLTDHFRDEKITLETLQIIKQKHIDRLLVGFPIGTQVLFAYNLEKWQSSFQFNPIDNLSTTTAFEVSPTISNNICSPPSSYGSPRSINSPLPIPNTSGEVTLSQILNESIKGDMLRMYYEKHYKFHESQRNILITFICQYFINKNLHMSLTTSYNLESEICKEFPNEKLEFYRVGKRGKLYNRYSNLKSNLKPICVETICKNQVLLNTNIKLAPEDDAEICVRSLKFDNLSAEEFDRAWQACTMYRLDQISKMNSTDEILEKWPYYKTPSGFRLIDMDFCHLFKTRNGFLDKWQEYANKLEEFLYADGNIRDKQIHSCLLELKVHPNVTDDNKCAILLWALHGYLIPSQKSVKKDTSGKNVITKYTIKDSQESFLYIGKSIQDLDNHITFISLNNKNIQPFIMAIGDDIFQLKEFFIYFDKVKFSFNSILRAADICFKIFHLFNLCYPTAATNFYLFFQELFYQMPTKTNEKNTKVNILLNELLGK